MKNLKKTCKTCNFSHARPFNGSVYGSCYGCNEFSMWMKKIPKLFPVLLIFVAAAVFCFCIILFMLTAGDVHAGNRIEYYSADSYSKDVRSQCEQLTRTKAGVSYRLNIPAAKACFDRSVIAHRQQVVEESYVNVNNAAADLMRDRTRLKNRYESGGRRR